MIYQEQAKSVFSNTFKIKFKLKNELNVRLPIEYILAGRGLGVSINNAVSCACPVIVDNCLCSALYLRIAYPAPFALTRIAVKIHVRLQYDLKHELLYLCKVSLEKERS